MTLSLEFSYERFTRADGLLGIAVTTAISKSIKTRRLVTVGAVVVLIICMILGTKVLSGSQAKGAIPGSFDPATYAKAKYSSTIAPAIIKRATSLSTVATAIKADESAAVKKYAVTEGSSDPVFSVSFTGVAGAVDSGGILPVQVSGVPSGVSVRVQMGPAVNGTAIRDATGKVDFSEFTNQIDYQNAAAALNDQVKKKVLSKVDAASLKGKTVTMVGAFQFVNPAAYLLTPVKISVTK